MGAGIVAQADANDAGLWIIHDPDARMRFLRPVIGFILGKDLDFRIVGQLDVVVFVKDPERLRNSLHHRMSGVLRMHFELAESVASRASTDKSFIVSGFFGP